jgi:hypothetical protein
MMNPGEPSKKNLNAAGGSRSAATNSVNIKAAVEMAR